MVYSGSLVNVITAHAFLETMAAEGHTGIIVTVGTSATGLAIAALARQKQISTIFLVRSQHARAASSFASRTRAGHKRHKVRAACRRTEDRSSV
jgi:NADPH:quinone reductase-like Zn-dependent oxidoreductase